MKLFLVIFFFYFNTLLADTIDLDDINLPFEKKNLEYIYKLENNDLIFIENFERGNRLWTKKPHSIDLNEISFLFNFISLAKNCETIKNKNIYFGQNREYWLGGGAIIDDAQIRIFDLYDKSPWRDSDLGIVPNMKWANQFCKFYKPLKYR